MADLIANAFKSDIFKMATLTDSVNKLPDIPVLIGDMGIFEPQPINTTVVFIEEKNGSVGLVPVSKRGGKGTPIMGDKRTGRTIEVLHLQADVKVYPDDVLNLRDFGSTTALAQLQTIVNDRLTEGKLYLSATEEFHRAGALQGKIYDSDGTTLLVNLFTQFGVSEQTTNFVFSVTTTDIKAACMEIHRKMKAAVGMRVINKVVCIYGAEWGDAFFNHGKVQDVLKYYEQGGMVLRGDIRKGFEIFGINFIEYNALLGTQYFLPTAQARAFPVGPGLYKSAYAPADYNETVGTLGLPYYAKSEEARMGKGIDIEVQSNPLHYPIYPAACIKVTKS